MRRTNKNLSGSRICRDEGNLKIPRVVLHTDFNLEIAKLITMTNLGTFKPFI